MEDKSGVRFKCQSAREANQRQIQAYVMSAHLIFALVVLLGPLHVQHQCPGPASELQGNALVHPFHHLTAESRRKHKHWLNKKPQGLKS